MKADVIGARLEGLLAEVEALAGAVRALREQMSAADARVCDLYRRVGRVEGRSWRCGGLSRTRECSAGLEGSDVCGGAHRGDSSTGGVRRQAGTEGTMMDTALVRRGLAVAEGRIERGHFLAARDGASDETLTALVEGLTELRNVLGYAELCDLADGGRVAERAGEEG